MTNGCTEAKKENIMSVTSCDPVESTISTKVMAELDTQVARLHSIVEELEARFTSVLRNKVQEKEAPINADKDYPSLFLMIHQLTVKIQDISTTLNSMIERSAL
jgi:hypothetical protein